MPSNNTQRNWTREETMLAFELYCTIPKGKDTVHNPQIIALASAINRTVNSVKLKLQNFKSCDPSYTAGGRVGLSNASALDREVCQEFLQSWDALLLETDNIKIHFNLSNIETNDITIPDIPTGSDIIRNRKERVGQSFFRQALLSAYNYKCCFTGIAIPELLKASHIKPWSKANDVNEKTNPQNGLLLNALHDSAFDRGYITISFDYKIIVSQKLLDDSSSNQKYFAPINEQNILLPSRFLPDRQFIEYHNDVIFKG